MEANEFESAKKAVIGAVIDLLKYKNEKYGNAALEPANIFYKGDSITSINIRLDDKLKRVINSGEFRKNDISDIVGYLFLALVSVKKANGISVSADHEMPDISFQAILKDVANEVYAFVQDETEPSGMFSKEPSYIKDSDDAIIAIKNSDEITKELYIGLLVPLINLMIDNEWSDLSEFKD